VTEEATTAEDTQAAETGCGAALGLFALPVALGGAVALRKKKKD
jgi:hypothetical protein